MENIAKSFFITIFPLFATYAFFQSGIHLFKEGLSFLHLGQLISSVTIIIFFARLFIKKQARTSTLLKGLSSVIFFGFLITLVVGGFIEKPAIPFFLTSTLLILGWIIYLKWYSNLGNRTDNTLLELNKPLPAFILEDVYKNKVSSETFIGAPTVFLFYRGNWCPLCMAQIKEISAQYNELEKRGVQVALISPQPHENSRSLAKKNLVSFYFLVDIKGKVAKQLRIFHKNGLPLGFQILGYDSDTVLPTVIITNNEGKIIFLDQTDNYRVRPEPETFLKVIDSISD